MNQNVSRARPSDQSSTIWLQGQRGTERKINVIGLFRSLDAGVRVTAALIIWLPFLSQLMCVCVPSFSIDSPHNGMESQ